MTIEIEQHITKNENLNSPIIYWGVYLDGKEVSLSSTKEQAENTKKWMENWLNHTH